MFCGWRLAGSKPRIAEFGSGTLEIDALTAQSFFEGRLLDELPIAKGIQSWLQCDLAAHKIPNEIVVSARLTARLLLSQISWAERTNKTQIFFANGSALRPEKMHRCIIECHSEVTTDDAVYHSDYREVEEWPIGWPAAT